MWKEIKKKNRYKVIQRGSNTTIAHNTYTQKTTTLQKSKRKIQHNKVYYIYIQLYLYTFMLIYAYQYEQSKGAETGRGQRGERGGGRGGCHERCCASDTHAERDTHAAHPDSA